MEKVEHIIEISSELEKNQQFCDFIKDVHTIAKCKKTNCPIGTYRNDIKKAVFDLALDYDVRRSLFIKFSMESSEVFSAMFG